MVHRQTDPTSAVRRHRRRAVALALNLAFPGLSVPFWAWFCGLSAAALVCWGRYRLIETAAVGLTVCFSVLTVLCAALLQWTPYRISEDMLASGLAFNLPAAAVGAAVAAFGLTGVSADEIISYPYWCLEKGYGTFVGRRDGSSAWTARARGWIRVMYVDALASMVIYTTVTAAFYLLGAAVLHARGEIPQGMELISTLSRTYTETLGPAAKGLFLAGAIAALYSTVFVACASGTRMFTDAFAQFGFLAYDDQPARRRWIQALAWILPITWTGIFFYVQSPVFMVMAGGIAIAALLLLVVFAAWHFRYRRLAVDLRPSRGYDLLLWISIAAILGVGVKALLS